MMDTEQPNDPKPDPKPKPSVWDIYRVSRAEALNIVNNMREVRGRPRQIVTGALLGVCIVFLIALVGAQRLDTPLVVASVAFAVALPFLGVDFIVASQDFKPNLSVFMVHVLKFAAFVVCEVLGALSVVVGIGAVLWHLGGAAVIAALVALGFALLTPILVLGVIILWLVVLNGKAQSAGVEVDLDEVMRKSRFLSLFAPTIAKPAEESAAQQANMQA